MTTRRRSLLYTALFFVLPVAFFLLFGVWGLPETDDGFLHSLSWRIVNGQLPYADFLYVRPPLSLYLHALPLIIIPESWQIIGERLFFYLSVATYSLLAVRLLLNVDEKKSSTASNTYLTLLAGISFLFSIVTVFPMPWHTVDGILLSVLGIAVLSKKDRWWMLGCGMLLLFLAALTKQSFYALPSVGVGMTILLYGWKKGLQALSWLSVFGGLFVALLAWTGLLEPFFAQTFGAVSSEWLYITGFRRYMSTTLLGGVGIVGLCIAQKKWFPHNRMALAAWAIIGAFGIFMAASLYFLPERRLPQDIFHIFFAIALYSALHHWQTHRRYSVILLALMAIGWSAAISWSLQLLLLFAAPFVIAAFWMIGKQFSQRKTLITACALFCAMLITTIALHLYPYQDSPRDQLVVDMGTVHPKLSHIRSDAQTAQKYSEALSFAAQYPNTTVLPAMLYFHSLTNTVPPIGVDWDLHGEIGRHQDALIAELEDGDVTVLLEKNSINRSATNFATPLSAYVYEHWNVVDETDYFLVMRR